MLDPEEKGIRILRNNCNFLQVDKGNIL